MALTPLPDGKTHIFSCPAAADDRVVRTGVEGDGDCFFHCLLRATDHAFKNQSLKDRTESIKGMRQTCARAVDPLFDELGAGELRRVLFLSELRVELERGLPTPDETGAEMAALFPPERLLRFLDRATESAGNRQILPEFVNLMASKIHSYYHPYLRAILKQMFTQINERIRHNFAQSLRQPGTFVEHQHLECISRALELNLVFLNEMGEVYSGAGGILNPDWDTIVLLWVGGNHYELVGVMDSSHYVLRRFPPHHSFLEKLGIYS